MVEPVRLEGAQVVLRDPVLADLDALRHWLQPGQTWQEFDGPYFPSPDAEAVDDLLSSLRDRIESASFPVPRQTLMIADRASDALLGRVSWYWESVETNWPAAGIVLYDPNTWRQGRGYEALGLWCDHLFTVLPEVVRLDLQTWSGNDGMVALAHKLGFREEARFRKARIVRGAYFDGLGFGILREEWAERFPDGWAADGADR